MKRILALLLGAAAVSFAMQGSPINRDDVNAETEAKQSTYYDVPLSEEMQEHIFRMCAKYRFPDAGIVVSVIESASGFNEKAMDGLGCYGYMMISGQNLGWLEEEMGQLDLLEGKDNIEAGVKILAEHWRRCQNMEKALMAYSLGEEGADRIWAAGIHETEFTREVMENRSELENKKEASEDTSIE